MHTLSAASADQLASSGLDGGGSSVESTTSGAPPARPSSCPGGLCLQGIPPHQKSLYSAGLGAGAAGLALVTSQYRQSTAPYFGNSLFSSPSTSAHDLQEQAAPAGEQGHSRFSSAVLGPGQELSPEVVSVSIDGDELSPEQLLAGAATQIDAGATAAAARRARSPHFGSSPSEERRGLSPSKQRHLLPLRSRGSGVSTATSRAASPFTESASIADLNSGIWASPEESRHPRGGTGPSVEGAGARDAEEQQNAGEYVDPLTTASSLAPGSSVVEESQPIVHEELAQSLDGIAARSSNGSPAVDPTSASSSEGDAPPSISYNEYGFGFGFLGDGSSSSSGDELDMRAARSPGRAIPLGMSDAQRARLHARETTKRETWKSFITGPPPSIHVTAPSGDTTTYSPDATEEAAGGALDPNPKPAAPATVKTRQSGFARFLEAARGTGAPSSSNVATATASPSVAASASTTPSRSLEPQPPTEVNSSVKHENAAAARTTLANPELSVLPSSRGQESTLSDSAGAGAARATSLAIPAGARAGGAASISSTNINYVAQTFSMATPRDGNSSPEQEESQPTTPASMRFSPRPEAARDGGPEHEQESPELQATPAVTFSIATPTRGGTEGTSSTSPEQEQQQDDAEEEGSGGLEGRTTTAPRGKQGGGPNGKIPYPYHNDGVEQEHDHEDQAMEQPGYNQQQLPLEVAAKGKNKKTARSCPSCWLFSKMVAQPQQPPRVGASASTQQEESRSDPDVQDSAGGDSGGEELRARASHDMLPAMLEERLRRLQLERLERGEQDENSSPSEDEHAAGAGVGRGHAPGAEEGAATASASAHAQAMEMESVEFEEGRRGGDRDSPPSLEQMLENLDSSRSTLMAQPVHPIGPQNLAGSTEQSLQTAAPSEQDDASACHAGEVLSPRTGGGLRERTMTPTRLYPPTPEAGDQYPATPEPGDQDANVQPQEVATRGESPLMAAMSADPAMMSMHLQPMAGSPGAGGVEGGGGVTTWVGVPAVFMGYGFMAGNGSSAGPYNTSFGMGMGQQPPWALNMNATQTIPVGDGESMLYAGHWTQEQPVQYGFGDAPSVQLYDGNGQPNAFASSGADVEGSGSGRSGGGGSAGDYYGSGVESPSLEAATTNRHDRMQLQQHEQGTAAPAAEQRAAGTNAAAYSAWPSVQTIRQLAKGQRARAGGAGGSKGAKAGGAWGGGHGGREEHQDSWRGTAMWSKPREIVRARKVAKQWREVVRGGGQRSASSAAGAVQHAAGGGGEQDEDEHADAARRDQTSFSTSASGMSRGGGTSGSAEEEQFQDADGQMNTPDREGRRRLRPDDIFRSFNSNWGAAREDLGSVSSSDVDRKISGLQLLAPPPLGGMPANGMTATGRHTSAYNDTARLVSPRTREFARKLWVRPEQNPRMLEDIEKKIFGDAAKASAAASRTSRDLADNADPTSSTSVGSSSSGEGAVDLQLVDGTTSSLVAATATETDPLPGGDAELADSSEHLPRYDPVTMDLRDDLREAQAKTNEDVEHAQFLARWANASTLERDALRELSSSKPSPPAPGAPAAGAGGISSPARIDEAGAALLAAEPLPTAAGGAERTGSAGDGDEDIVSMDFALGDLWEEDGAAAERPKNDEGQRATAPEGAGAGFLDDAEAPAQMSRAQHQQEQKWRIVSPNNCGKMEESSLQNSPAGATSSSSTATSGSTPAAASTSTSPAMYKMTFLEALMIGDEQGKSGLSTPASSPAGGGGAPGASPKLPAVSKSKKPALRRLQSMPADLEDNHSTTSRTSRAASSWSRADSGSIPSGSPASSRSPNAPATRPQLRKAATMQSLEQRPESPPRDPEPEPKAKTPGFLDIEELARKAAALTDKKQAGVKAAAKGPHAQPQRKGANQRQKRGEEYQLAAEVRYSPSGDRVHGPDSAMFGSENAAGGGTAGVGAAHAEDAGRKYVGGQKYGKNKKPQLALATPADILTTPTSTGTGGGDAAEDEMQRQAAELQRQAEEELAQTIAQVQHALDGLGLGDEKVKDGGVAAAPGALATDMKTDAVGAGQYQLQEQQPHLEEVERAAPGAVGAAGEELHQKGNEIEGGGTTTRYRFEFLPSDARVPQLQQAAAGAASDDKPLSLESNTPLHLPLPAWKGDSPGGEGLSCSSSGFDHVDGLDCRHGAVRVAEEQQEAAAAAGAALSSSGAETERERPAIKIADGSTLSTSSSLAEEEPASSPGAATSTKSSKARRLRKKRSNVGTLDQGGQEIAGVAAEAGGASSKQPHSQQVQVQRRAAAGKMSCGGKIACAAGAGALMALGGAAVIAGGMSGTPYTPEYSPQPPHVHDPRYAGILQNRDNWGTRTRNDNVNWNFNFSPQQVGLQRGFRRSPLLSTSSPLTCVGEHCASGGILSPSITSATTALTETEQPSQKSLFPPQGPEGAGSVVATTTPAVAAAQTPAGVRTRSDDALGRRPFPAWSRSRSEPSPFFGPTFRFPSSAEAASAMKLKAAPVMRRPPGWMMPKATTKREIKGALLLSRRDGEREGQVQGERANSDRDEEDDVAGESRGKGKRQLVHSAGEVDHGALFDAGFEVDNPLQVADASRTKNKSSSSSGEIKGDAVSESLMERWSRALDMRNWRGRQPVAPDEAGKDNHEAGTNENTSPQRHPNPSLWKTTPRSIRTTSTTLNPVGIRTSRSPPPTAANGSLKVALAAKSAFAREQNEAEGAEPQQRAEKDRQPLEQATSRAPVSTSSPRPPEQEDGVEVGRPDHEIGIARSRPADGEQQQEEDYTTSNHIKDREVTGHELFQDVDEDLDAMYDRADQEQDQIMDVDEDVDGADDDEGEDQQPSQHGSPAPAPAGPGGDVGGDEDTYYYPRQAAKTMTALGVMLMHNMLAGGGGDYDVM